MHLQALALPHGHTRHSMQQSTAQTQTHLAGVGQQAGVPGKGSLLLLRCRLGQGCRQGRPTAGAGQAGLGCGGEGRELVHARLLPGRVGAGRGAALQRGRHLDAPLKLGRVGGGLGGGTRGRLLLLPLPLLAPHVEAVVLVGPLAGTSKLGWVLGKILPYLSPAKIHFTHFYSTPFQNSVGPSLPG